MAPDTGSPDGIVPPQISDEHGSTDIAAPLASPPTTTAAPATADEPRCSQEHILACQFSRWYPVFKHCTPRSVVVDLSEDITAYLQQDGVVLPKGFDMACERGLQEDSDDEVDWDEDEDDDDQRVSDQRVSNSTLYLSVNRTLLLSCVLMSESIQLWRCVPRSCQGQQQYLTRTISRSRLHEVPSLLSQRCCYSRPARSSAFFALALYQRKGRLNGPLLLESDPIAHYRMVRRCLRILVYIFQILSAMSAGMLELLGHYA